MYLDPRTVKYIQVKIVYDLLGAFIGVGLFYANSVAVPSESRGLVELFLLSFNSIDTCMIHLKTCIKINYPCQAGRRSI